MSRLKKALKWTGVTLALLATTLLLANAWYVSSASRRLEEKLARLRADDQPISLVDLVRPSIPVDQNARALLHQAATEVFELRKQLTALSPNQSQLSLDNAEHREAAGQLFAQHEALFSLLDRAARCDDYVPEVRAELTHTQYLEQTLAETSETREVFRLLSLRVQWLLAEERRDEAFETTLTQLKLARHLRRNPLIVWHLVAIACQHSALENVEQLLDEDKLSETQRQTLDAELALHDSREGYRWALSSERASALTALREMPGFDLWISRGFACDGASHLIDMMDEYLRAVDRPYPELVAQKQLARPPARSANAYLTVVELLKPAVDVAREPAERSIAYSRALRVLNAIQARGASREPLALEQLGLPAAAIMDPFSTTTLRVKPVVNGGWRVYSVGKNGEDDGGESANQADICAESRWSGI